MTPGLDLSSCDAKLARAREHLDALQRETTAGVKQESPYAVRFSEVDPQTGWCTISLIPHEMKKPRLSAIFGDVIHNLRCALDYIVTALVDTSHTKLTTSHQFPVFLDAAEYAKRVGSNVDANPKGPLRGVTYGLALIEKWQPYHTKPDPRTDPLWGIHRFSNADKHREPLTFAPRPVGKFDIAFKGIVVEEESGADVPNWTPDQEIVLKRLRFDPPRAEDLRAEGEIGLNVGFETPAFGDDADLSVTLAALPGIVDHVAKVVELFKTV